MTHLSQNSALDTYRWRDLGYTLPGGHRPRIRRIYSLQPAEDSTRQHALAVRVEGITGGGFVFVAAVAGVAVGCIPLTAVDPARLVEVLPARGGST